MRRSTRMNMTRGSGVIGRTSAFCRGEDHSRHKTGAQALYAEDQIQYTNCYRRVEKPYSLQVLGTSMAASVVPAHRVPSGAPVGTDVRTPTGPGPGLVRSFHSATPGGLAAAGAGRASQHPNPARHQFAGAPAANHSYSLYQQSPWVSTVAPSRGPRPLSVPPVRFREGSADSEARAADSGTATFLGLKPQREKPWTVRDLLADTGHKGHANEVQAIETHAEKEKEQQQKHEQEDTQEQLQQQQQQQQEQGHTERKEEQEALPPTALSGEELIKAAPATPIILAKTLEDKADEIIARYVDSVRCLWWGVGGCRQREVARCRQGGLGSRGDLPRVADEIIAR